MSSLRCWKNVDSDIELYRFNYDTVDKPPNSYHVSFLYVIGLICSIILHVVDLGFDINVIYSYYATGKYVYFVWTIAFVSLSAIIINLISVTMYVEDPKNKINTKHTSLRIILCLLGIPLQSAPLIRYFDSLWYAFKSLKAKAQSDIHQQKKYFNKMLSEDSDAALLKIFECYLEAAPQLILQATLLVKDLSQGHAEHQTGQLILISLGFIALGWGVANYHRCIRLDQEDKMNISTFGFVVQFFWHLNFTVSRILTVIAVATLNTFWAIIAVSCHWFVMTVWVGLTSKTQFCAKNKILKLFFFSIVGIVCILNFFKLNDGSTRQSYVIFYLLCFGENFAAATIWGMKSISPVENWVYYTFTIFPVFCFLLSVIFLIVYYQFLHPNRSKGCKMEEFKPQEKVVDRKQKAVEIE